MTPAYARLKSRFARIAILGEAQSMLDWDAAAMMPAGGGPARADQLATLAGLGHEMMLAPELAEDLATAEANPPHAQVDAQVDAANLHLMRRAHIRATALPTELVEAQEHANATCEKAWRQARADNDFALVQPHLQHVVTLARQRAGALGAALGLAPYDALMDSYQRGVLAADVTPIFDRYLAFLATALPEAEARQAAAPAPIPFTGTYPADRQEQLCRTIAARIGLDFQHARLDRSAHPFCGGTPSDIRITTRYDEADPAKALLGVMHETGHALYNRGLPAAHRHQPVGDHAGMAAHESQSLIIEMQACRSTPFLHWLTSEMAATLGSDPALDAAGNLQRLWRRVERSFIRVDADEMTYPAHIIMRFRLEQALMAGDLAVRDLPAAWNDGMRQVLGITPPNDREGCLQDIHWYFGAFGYFPSYTIGAMAAAQLMAAARRAEPAIDDALGHGSLAPLTAWLHTHVHQHGNRHGFDALLASATGTALDASHFESHLAARYL